MKNKTLILTILLFLLPVLLKSQMALINWTDDTISINSDVYINSNTVLKINPGVTVLFYGYYSIYIEGLLIAKGNKNDSIVFTVADTTGFSDIYSENGSWHGLRFNNRTNNDTSFINYCILKYTKTYLINHFQNGNEMGGAIYSHYYSNIDINGCSFKNNIACQKGGAIYVSDNLSLNVNSSNFINNKSFFKGGGLYVKNTDSKIENNLFYKNSASDVDSVLINDTLFNIGYEGMGGALYLEQNNNLSIVNNNRFFNNFSALSTVFINSKDYLFENNLLCNNDGYAFYDGFGINGNGKIINNTIANNVNYLYVIGGVYALLFNGDFDIRNNIIWYNFSGWDWYQINSGLLIYYNCIMGGYGHPSLYNIKENPWFVNPTPGPGLAFDGLSADWTLMEDSPCINAGTPDTTGLNIPAVDIAGNPRIFGNRIDMGAYENQTVWVKVNNAPVADNINIYPNPGNDKINISLPGNNTPVWFDMSDATGQTVIHTRLYNELSAVYPQNLPAGIYFYRVFDKEKVIKSGKWIKR